MSRTASRPVTAVAACAAALGLTLAATAPAAATVRSDPAGRHTAAEIHRFLTGFYGQQGPTSHQRAHQVSAYLKDRAAHTDGYELLLCAQNTPRTITVGTVTTAQSAGVGWATVTTGWGGGATRSFTAYVGLESHPITLQDVDCGQ
ncbi:hypothetical protein O1L44_22360 [Streptomyces noursei]|uniref:hypothetical protein n=1 Tax=Streptomyces noursei TaxID=1971 RepID=UPI00081C96A2|nr:membrane protein [Streptomyces noursei ATCC 11455]MCZ0995283.1 hypothetical protein [Streptomyces noursei]